MSAQSFNRPRILIGLRNEIALNAYRAFLIREGFRVTITTNALACWAELECERPDILVIDHDLPWGGGDGVLAMIDEEPGMRDIPVVAISHEGASLAGSHSLRLTFGSYPSPSELAKQLERIKASLTRSQMRRSLECAPQRPYQFASEKVA